MENLFTLDKPMASLSTCHISGFFLGIAIFSLQSCKFCVSTNDVFLSMLLRIDHVQHAVQACLQGFEKDIRTYMIRRGFLG